jgi:hypothetical protein
MTTRKASTPKVRGAIVGDPTAPIVARAIFADGKVLAAGVAIVVTVPIGAAARWRARVKITGTTATLAAAYCRNKTGNAAYSTNNPVNVALADAVENVMDNDTHRGEAMIKFTLTPVGAGVLNYFDFMGV